MTDDGDSTLPAPDSPVEQLDEFRALVRSAFEQAQRKGKQDWEEMTSAVLKNRLLNITEGQFSQARYGSPSFINLVRRVPDLLEIIDNSPPFHLRIISPDTTQAGELVSQDAGVQTGAPGEFASLMKGDLRRIRIRDDLWHAIVDYSSGNTYVLDADTGLARSKTASDPSLPQLPTASREEISAWRQEFIESLDPSGKARYADELENWVTGRGRQSDLPGPIRGLWAEFIKRKVINRLLDWFYERSQAAPNDMIFATARRRTPTSDVIGQVVQTRHLRDLIIRAVRIMTYEELSQVSLPAAVVLRISGGRQGEND